MASTYLSWCPIAAPRRPNQQRCLQRKQVHEVLTGTIPCIAPLSIPRGTMQIAKHPHFLPPKCLTNEKNLPFLVSCRCSPGVQSNRGACKEKKFISWSVNGYNSVRHPTEHTTRHIANHSTPPFPSTQMLSKGKQ